MMKFLTESKIAFIKNKKIGNTWDTLKKKKKYQCTFMLFVPSYLIIVQTF